MSRSNALPRLDFFFAWPATPRWRCIEVCRHQKRQSRHTTNAPSLDSADCGGQNATVQSPGLKSSSRDLPPSVCRLPNAITLHVPSAGSRRAEQGRAAGRISDSIQVDSPSVDAGKARISSAFHNSYTHLLLAPGLRLLPLSPNDRCSCSAIVHNATWQTLIYLFVLVLGHRTRTPIKSALVHQLPQAPQPHVQTS